MLKVFTEKKRIVFRLGNYRHNFDISFEISSGFHLGVWYCEDGFLSFDFVLFSIRIGKVW